MKGERHVGGEIRVLSNLIKRCMDDGMPPETTGMQGSIIGFLHRNADRDMFQRDVEAEFNIRRSTATGSRFRDRWRFAFSSRGPSKSAFFCGSLLPMTPG